MDNSRDNGVEKMNLLSLVYNNDLSALLAEVMEERKPSGSLSWECMKRNLSKSYYLSK